MADVPFGGLVGSGGAAAFRSGPVIQGSVSSLAPAYVDGTVNPISIDATGALRTAGAAQAKRSTATFTPTAAAYTAQDIMESAKEFANVGPAGAIVRILSSKLRVDVSALQASEANYRLWLFNATPPSALADNAAWDYPSGDRSTYLGYLDLGTPVDLGATLWSQVTGHDLDVTLVTTSLFGYLTNTATFTPTAAARVASIFALPL